MPKVKDKLLISDEQFAWAAFSGFAVGADTMMVAVEVIGGGALPNGFGWAVAIPLLLIQIGWARIRFGSAPFQRIEVEDDAA